MTYKYATLLKWISVCTDFFLLNLALYFAFVISSPIISFWDFTSETYRLSFLLLNLLWFYCGSIFKLYENVIVRDAVTTIKLITAALGVYLVVPFVLTVTFTRLSFSTDFFIYSFVLFSVLILFSRLLFFSLRKSKRKFWIRYKKIVIVGDGKLGHDFYNYIENNPQLGYTVAGVFGDGMTVAGKTENGRVNVLGSIENCLSYAIENGISEILCTLPDRELDKVKGLIREADKHMIRFRLVPDIKGAFEVNTMLELYGNLPILTHRKEPLENKANEVIKRAFDFGFSLFVVVFVLSWLVPVIGFIIKLDSKGPVFFKQLRSGKDNKPFYCYKFRSMTVNSAADNLQATKGDARITRVGTFLRKTSLDELPQFFNVLLGDMSVVGPRPHMLKHTQDYSLLIGNFMVRHFLTPGITGWAQVSGHRGETKETTAMSKRVEADLWYLENWTLFLDLKIIFLTIWNSLKGDEKAF